MRRVLDRLRTLAHRALGTEALLRARTAELEGECKGLRLVLDNVSEGFLTMNLDGTMGPRSLAAAGWLGSHDSTKKLWEAIPFVDESARAWFALSWQAIADGDLPLEVCLEQLPKTVTDGSMTLALSYAPLCDESGVEKVMVVLSDVTARLARDRAEKEQRELLSLFQSLLRDRAGFLEFVREANQLVRQIAESDDVKSVLRDVHTLKGISGFFGLDAVATACHDLETAALEQGPSEAERKRLTDTFAIASKKLESLLGGAEPRVEIDEAEHRAFVEALSSGVSTRELLGRALSWKLEPAERRLGRVAEHIRATGDRLGRRVAVSVDGNGLRFAPGAWAPFWSSFAHAVRNALDHGIEPSEERVASGKDPEGNISLSARVTSSVLEIAIEDDGRGIDRDRVRDRAAVLGLEAATEQDLAAALFHDGLSTASTTTEFSGRGVGMAALRETTERMGGRIEISTQRGQGTRIAFLFPASLAARDPIAVSRSAHSVAPAAN